MNKRKKEKIQKSGFKIGSVSDFLNLSEEESSSVEKHVIQQEFNSYSIADEVYAKDPDKLKKYQDQRLSRGFDDTETWHLDKTLALFLIPRLKRFLEVNNGFPSGETEESYNEKLNFIVNSFEEYYCENLSENVSLETEKLKLENARKAVDFLSKLWFDLWW